MTLEEIVYDTLVEQLRRHFGRELGDQFRLSVGPTPDGLWRLTLDHDRFRRAFDVRVMDYNQCLDVLDAWVEAVRNFRLLRREVGK